MTGAFVTELTSGVMRREPINAARGALKAGNAAAKPRCASTEPGVVTCGQLDTAVRMSGAAASRDDGRGEEGGQQAGSRRTNPSSRYCKAMSTRTPSGRLTVEPGASSSRAGRELDFCSSHRRRGFLDRRNGRVEDSDSGGKCLELRQMTFINAIAGSRDPPYPDH